MGQEQAGHPITIVLCICLRSKAVCKFTCPTNEVESLPSEKAPFCKRARWIIHRNVSARDAQNPAEHNLPSPSPGQCLQVKATKVPCTTVEHQALGWLATSQRQPLQLFSLAGPGVAATKILAQHSHPWWRILMHPFILQIHLERGH